jgi:hypothetical protein
VHPLNLRKRGARAFSVLFAFKLCHFRSEGGGADGTLRGLSFLPLSNIRPNENVVSASGELEIFEEITGKAIAYRVREPKPDDFDTYLMKARQKRISSYTVHTWEIAQDIRFREATKYDKKKDETKDEVVETDEIRHTKFVGIPSLGVFAVEDTLSERSLGARSAVGRCVAVIETLKKDFEVRITFAGTPVDAQRALDTWSLDQFTFTVRPFNPTPRKLGEQLHEFMVADKMGTLRAVALPDEHHEMRDSRKGLISEVKGLSDAGYGQYGAAGKTPDGLHASISKPKFELDKSKNIRHQAQNRMLKVYIEHADSLDQEEAAIVKALLDLYGPAKKA